MVDEKNKTQEVECVMCGEPAYIDEDGSILIAHETQEPLCAKCWDKNNYIRLNYYPHKLDEKFRAKTK